VPYSGGPNAAQPHLVTSFADFENVYGGLDVLHTPTDADKRLPYLAHAVRAFFENGGRKLYVSRVFVPRGTEQLPDYGVAHFSIPVCGVRATWRARWPGKYGNASIAVKAVRGPNVAFQASDFGGAVQAKGVQRGALVEIVSAAKAMNGDEPIELTHLAQISLDAHDGRQVFSSQGKRLTPSAADAVRHITLTVVVATDDKRVRVYEGLETHAHGANYIGAVLQRDDPADKNSVVYLDWDSARASGSDIAAHLMTALLEHAHVTLTGGHDGAMLSAADLAGSIANANAKAGGLTALADVEDIAVVAVPEASTLDGDGPSGVAAELIKHAELLRYRFAVIDSPPQSSPDDVRRFRRRLQSSRAALYYPWLVEHEQDALPPSGFVCGIYARHDLERGVHKAPANEVVRGVTKPETSVNDADNAILDNEGINAIRALPYHGVRVWAARTMSPDPEWKYVNVRRLLIYLEHSIDKGTQWAVFEPNGDQLWANIRRAIEDFLFNEWRNGSLLGNKPEEAFFVRCDRTTMTQDDLDNGRLVCLVGVAPVKPAEFVIFRIGQWTASANCT
jgi:hypothetical protein